jgi:hypothetical protein
MIYGRTLLPTYPNNFIFYLYGLPQFDAIPISVTFILDDNGASEYFRTRSFVAKYKSEIPPEPGQPGRFRWLSTETHPVVPFERFLPEPRLPFIRPPSQ